MRRRTVLAILAVVAILVAATIFVETSTIIRSDKLRCTDTVIIWYPASTVGTSQVTYYETSMTTYTSHTNSTASVGYATTVTLGFADTTRVCTYIK